MEEETAAKPGKDLSTDGRFGEIVKFFTGICGITG
jgi:hypothetical protein